MKEKKTTFPFMTTTVGYSVMHRRRRSRRSIEQSEHRPCLNENEFHSFRFEFIFQISTLLHKFSCYFSSFMLKKSRAAKWFDFSPYFISFSYYITYSLTSGWMGYGVLVGLWQGDLLFSGNLGSNGAFWEWAGFSTILCRWTYYIGRALNSYVASPSL